MKNQFSKMALIAAGALLTFSACNNSPYPGYDQVESGYFAKFYNHDEAGVMPKEGDVVRVSLVVKNDKDSVLTDSKDAKFNRPGLTYYEFPLMKPEFIGSFEEALRTMAVGDSASFLISVDSMYKGREMPPFMKKGSLLTYETKLEKIISKDEVEKENVKKKEEQRVMMELQKNEESKILAKYLADNKITAQPTATGLYYIETKKGSGAKPKTGQMVKVNYTGRLIDGTIFDTSDEATAKKENIYDERRGEYKPIEFPIGTGGVIKGWDEGIMLMSPGSKGKLIIPSDLAYGDGGGRMAPFATLVFDVELISISDAK
ncbi:MAG: FKBP-type peptidyl-prolyl cis-trans isomerase [Bacteroidota bacterium]|nr:FKBP-type peptidyl-prolyl cis-trans isomerase [Bacteroidota bacterium]